MHAKLAKRQNTNKTTTTPNQKIKKVRKSPTIVTTRRKITKITRKSITHSSPTTSPSIPIITPQKIQSLQKISKKINPFTQNMNKSNTILTTSQRFISFHPPGLPEDGEVYKSIIEKINNNIPKIKFFDLKNESHLHSGPPNRESHFKIIIIAPFITELNQKMLISRHRFINQLLDEEIQGGVHALSLNLFTEEEFLKRGESIPNSPGCASQSLKSSSSSSSKINNHQDV